VGIAGTTLYRGDIQISPDIPPEAADAARESVAGAMAVSGQLPPAQGSNLLDSAFQAITTSLHGSSVICAVLCLAAAVLVVIGLRDTPRSDQPAPEAEQIDEAEGSTEQTAARSN
jgi:DHA2 family multidrug resistance protein-like MFS transporter